MKSYVAFGIGINFYSYVERIDSVCNIVAFSDNNPNHWGKYIFGDERKCVAPFEISNYENVCVIITSEKENSIQAIEKRHANADFS